MPRWRLAGAAVLGALTVVFGVGLMATSGYLISRAAERPPILSLMVTIVAVQFFGIGRPCRPLPRAARLPRHDAARARRGCARASSSGSSRWRRPSSTPTARATCSRGWSPTSTRSRTCTCAASSRRSSRCWPAPCRSAPPSRFLPAAGLVLAGGLLVGGAGRARARGVARHPGRPPAGGRSRTSCRPSSSSSLRGRARARRVRRRGGGARPRPRRRPDAGQAGPPRRARRRRGRRPRAGGDRR